MKHEWFNQQTAFLNAKLGLYQLSAGRNFFFDPTPSFYGLICQGTTDALNQGLRRLADHIIAPSSPVIDPWEGSADPLTTQDYDWTMQSGPAGMIRYDGPLRSRIQIAITNKHSPHILGATLAHELAHHFLINKGIYYPDVAENERMTDFATVFLGLGKLTLNGYNPMQWSIRRGDKIINYSYKVGYLSSQEIADAMVHVCAFRSIPLSEIKANLTSASCERLHVAFINERIRRPKQWLKKYFWRLLSSRNRRITPSSEAKPATSSRETTQITEKIIQCSKCGQKLRIPNRMQPLRVACPSCRNTFEV